MLNNEKSNSNTHRSSNESVTKKTKERERKWDRVQKSMQKSSVWKCKNIRHEQQAWNQGGRFRHFSLKRIIVLQFKLKFAFM